MPKLQPDATYSFDEARNLIVLDQELLQAIAQVRNLDFAMLRKKLMEDKHWTEEYCREVEDLYRKFLALNIRYPGRKICPTGPIDDFWHAHILDTAAYASDCERLFGNFLHHFPYFGMRGPDDRQALESAFQDSMNLFVLHFGIDPCAGDTQARSCAPQRCP
jgi:hypothetical protein